MIVPWVLYQRFGDPAILAAQFESMRAYVERIADLAGETRLWDQGFQLGDWLDPAAPPDQPGEACTDRHLVATAYFARSAELVGQAAGVLGLAEAESHYRSLAAKFVRPLPESTSRPRGVCSAMPRRLTPWR